MVGPVGALASERMASLGLASSGLWILRSADAPLLGRAMGRMALHLVTSTKRPRVATNAGLGL